ncbi:MAG TPA: hypothetical protein VHU81_18455, partial [Thermoanaerobaculia bacterium]|nr:hypothetical protein [Thermoanaerobaculia bacterium]
AVHLPTLLLTDLPRPVCVLAALLVAALVTGFEAISLQGADNLFVPLAVVVILGKITTKPLPEVIFQNLSLLAICLGVALVVWKAPSLNVGGAITFILFAYGTWSLGSWQWAIPVALGFAGYVTAWSTFAPPRHALGVKVRTVARALLPPFTLLLLANSFRDNPTYFGPYLAASGAVFAFSLDTGVFRLEKRAGGRWVLGALGLGLLAGIFVAFVPWRIQRVPAEAFLALLGAVMAVSLANAAIELRDREAQRSREWTAWRFLLSYAAAGAILAAQAFGGLAPWDPSWMPGWWIG